MHPLPLRVLLLLCACLSSWGCVTAGALQTADTLGAGNSRWNIRGTAQLHGTDELGPEASVGYQYGVADSMDLGLRLFTAGGELSGKVRLVPRESRTVVSLAPELGGRFLLFEEYRNLYAALPLLVGFVEEDGDQLVLGLRPMVMRTWGTYPPTVFTEYWLGTSVGYAWRVGNGVRVMPELAVSAAIGSARTSFRPVPQLGVAIMLDGGSGR